MPIELTLRDDKIVHVDITSSHVLNTQVFFEIADKLREFKKLHNSPLPCIITTNPNIVIDKAVRDLLKSKFFKNHTSAGAIVSSIEAQVLFVNVFVRIAKLHNPVRMFKTREKALIWLQQYVPN
jgi:hypothetical protein